MIGDYLKNKRLMSNLSQEQFAKKIGIDQSYYSLLETNEKKPGFKTIRKLSKSLKVSVEELRNEIDK